MTSKRPDTTAGSTAEYLATMCDQLAGLAERDGLKVGAHLLKMAQLEFAGLAGTQLDAKHLDASHATR
jgi:hypothetical protein